MATNEPIPKAVCPTTLGSSAPRISKATPTASRPSKTRGSSHAWPAPSKNAKVFTAAKCPNNCSAALSASAATKAKRFSTPSPAAARRWRWRKKLGREFLGTELSEDYVEYATDRLEEIHVGAQLDGPADPIASAPSTRNGRKLSDVQRTNGEQKPLPALETMLTAHSPAARALHPRR